VKKYIILNLTRKQDIISFETLFSSLIVKLLLINAQTTIENYALYNRHLLNFHGGAMVRMVISTNMTLFLLKEGILQRQNAVVNRFL
ncbi:hypothetical protein Goarm_014589, partial [Gossypium armourianum]|nr:hypothetical protein [Gossypium armourianum]